MGWFSASRGRLWATLVSSLLLACVSGPQRAADALALTAGAYGQPGGSGGSVPGIRAPLSMARLVRLAQEKGIGLVGAPVTRYRAIGLAFQDTVLRSLDVPGNKEKFPSPERGGPYTAVIPDGVLLAGRLNIAGRVSFNPNGAFLEVVGTECLEFVEVKARSCRLSLSSGRRQLQGFINALARQRPGGSSLMGPQPPRSALLLVTTEDTQVAEDVSIEAGRYGVALFQAVAWEAAGLITVGPFVQRTGFADVPQQFPLPSRPEPLIP